MYFRLVRSGLLMAGLLGGVALLASGATAESTQANEGFQDLFNGKDFTGWKIALFGKGEPDKTFSVREGVIVVSGHPNGYFYTEKSYKNYVLRFDWTYPKKAGNSGCLIHIQKAPTQNWPKCVEVQGLYADHGRIFAISGAHGDFSKDKEAVKAVQKKAIKPIGEWNTTEVLSKDGQLTSKINGLQIDTGKGELTEGLIGFQSEGAEILFKNIKIKVLE